MKLLLTSNGITTPILAQALESLTGKSAKQAKIAFVPTAANAEAGDKYWLIDDLARLKALGYTLDILDIAAIPKSWWLPRMELADIIFVGGGNVYYLLDHMHKSGLAAELPRLLQTRVYAGISAGSMAACTYTSSKMAEVFGEAQEAKAEFAPPIEQGLGFADIYIKPHYQSTEKPGRTDEWATNIAKKVDFPLYFLNDNSAVQVIDGQLEVVGSGAFKYFAADSVF